MNAASKALPLVARTAVVVVGIYDLLLLWPATDWLSDHAFSDFGTALPAPTQFVVDAHWPLVLGVLVIHGSAIWLAPRRFGLAACAAALVLSGMLTALWVWAMHLPLFSIAGAIK